MSKIDLNGKVVFITGAAGFIGANLAKRICQDYPDTQVIGIDNLNDYYDVSLKEYRLDNLKQYTNFNLIKGNIAEKDLVNSLFTEYKPSIVVNLAAQAGVRYSIQNPDAYIESITKQMAGQYRLVVATSDNLEQKIVLGHGATRISSRELLQDVISRSKIQKEEFERKNPQMHSYAFEDLKKS